MISVPQIWRLTRRQIKQTDALAGGRSAAARIGQATVFRAFEELEDKGLLFCTKRGQWYGRQASTWAVTLLPVGGKLATHEYKLWRPPQKAAIPASAGQQKQNAVL